MRRGSPLREGCPRKPPKPRKALPALGKRGKAWQAAWREIKPKLERAGITRCEVCGTGSMLTPAHSLKRRNCTTPELLREVIIACVECHSELEILPERAMALRVREIIAARPIPV